MKKRNIIILIILIILLISTLFMKKEVVEPFQTTRAGYDKACSELVNKRNFLRDYVDKLRAPVQNLSATMVAAKQAKKDNMGYQKTFTKFCSDLRAPIEAVSDANGNPTNTSNEAKACRALASTDKYQLELLPDIDVFYATVLLENEDRLDYALRYINFYTNMMKCPIPDDSKVTFDPTEKLLVPDACGNLVNPNTHITISRDIGSLDTQRLALELEKLSPYYLSPDVVKFIIRFMISQEKMDYLHDTSSDFVDGIGNLMNEIYKRYYPSSTTTLLGTYTA